MRLLDDPDSELLAATTGGWASHPWLDTADSFWLEPMPPITAGAPVASL